jgi:hypothetical protein
VKFWPRFPTPRNFLLSFAISSSRMRNVRSPSGGKIACAADKLVALLSERWETLIQEQGSGRRLQPGKRAFVEQAMGVACVSRLTRSILSL